MEDIKIEDYNEFKAQTLEFIKKILVNVVTVQNMVKDGKAWHAVNKLDGVLDQIGLLALRQSQFPEHIVPEDAVEPQEQLVN